MSHPQHPDQGGAVFDGDIFGFSDFPLNSQLPKRRVDPFAFDNFEQAFPSNIQGFSQPLAQSHPHTHGHAHSHAIPHSHQPQQRSPYPKFPASSSFEYSEPSMSPLGTISSFDNKGGSGFDDMTESVGDESKRSKKLEKNRESARLCRRRKKAYIQSLEEKVGRLSSRIQELQQEYWYTKEKLRDEQRKVAIALEGLVNGKDTEKDCAVLLARFNDICYKQGQSAILYHLEQIKDLLIPAQQVKFILWGLDQHDEFYDMGSKSSGGTIWSMLSDELGWTDEQRQRLIQYRDFIRAQNKELTSCILKFDLLRDEICLRLDSLQRCVNEIRTLFTPQQQAKFVVWVEQNQAVMKMLNTVMALPRERQEESEQEQDQEQDQEQFQVTTSESGFSDSQSHNGHHHHHHHGNVDVAQSNAPPNAHRAQVRYPHQSHQIPAFSSYQNRPPGPSFPEQGLNTIGQGGGHPPGRSRGNPGFSPPNLDNDQDLHGLSMGQ